MKADEFKNKRINLGLSQEYLSEIFEVRQNIIFKFETGKLKIPKVFELALEALEKRQPSSKTNALNLTSADTVQIIEEARNAEICRDLHTLRILLQNFWNDFEKYPDFENYEGSVRGELFRLSGVYLSFYGNAQSLKNYQSRGKDLLIRSIELFDEVNLPDKSAEAKVMLAFCYYNEGEINECELILSSVELEFGENLFNPVYIQICVNRLLVYYYKNDFKSALKIIKKISEPIRFCSDLRLQAMFYNQAGLFYTLSKEFSKAIFNLGEAIRISKKAGNRFFVAINLNNLANLYQEISEFKKADECIAESIDEVDKLNHRGFYPHILDTKALIYLGWGKYGEALRIIDAAIEHFRTGEDYRGYTAALWTRVRCLLRLDRRAEAFVEFVNLQNLAAERIGEIAVNKFAESLSEETYSLRGLPLLEEVSEFKKS